MTPIMKTVPRTWMERLFTLPWKPLLATKEVRDYKAEFARPRPTMVRADNVRRVVRMPARVEPPAPGLRREVAPPPRDHGPVYNDWPVTAQVPSFFPDTVAYPQPDDAPVRSGGGGDFAGGGASGGWDEPSKTSDSSSDAGASSSDSSSTSGD